MKYILLIYNDPDLLGALPAGQFDARLRDCFAHADELQGEGTLSESQMLEPAATAKSLRVRGGRRTIVDGPFAETKEMLAGFNIIEADSMEEALRIAAEFPWAQTGCVEVREVKDIDAVRARVGAASGTLGASRGS